MTGQDRDDLFIQLT